MRMCRRSIKYYLNEDPILENVETLLMSDAAQRDHVCQKLDEYVVKAVGESGGYGMLIGPHEHFGAALGISRQDYGGAAKLYCATDD